MSDINPTSTVRRKDESVELRLRSIVKTLRQRTEKVKNYVEQPPTPEDSEDDLDNDEDKIVRELILDDFTESRYASKKSLADLESENKSWRQKLKFSGYIDPRGKLNIGWLALMTLCFIYNAWAIPFRQFFKHYQQPQHFKLWFTLDYLADFLYLLDIVVIKYRIMFMKNGFWVKDKKELVRNYVHNGRFWYDVLALLPTDFLYFKLGVNNPFVRLPRLMKYGDFTEFFIRLDARIRHYQYILRLMKTIIYMVYLIHLNACAYFAISYYEGIGSNSFVYDGVGNAYFRCFYFATKTATSIGKNNKPQNTAEIVFMICSWMVGVFFFSILVGNIRDILGTAMKNKNEFRARQSAINSYMVKYKVPKLVQDRVKLWMEFSWEQQKNLDENKMLSFLPGKMRTDLALRVHFSTLSKVKLFQDCDQGLLKELVTKLKPIIFLPGDYICRKDDIGREMYIVESGYVMVLGPPSPGTKSRKVLVTLGQGSVFGEIALLGVAGIGRRTADVVSKGFSNLFSLRKEDLEAALKYYPEAKRILNNKAKKLIREKGGEEKVVKPEKDEILFCGKDKKDPALLEAVMNVLPRSSMANLYLTRGSRAASLDAS